MFADILLVFKLQTRRVAANSTRLFDTDKQGANATNIILVVHFLRLEYGFCNICYRRSVTSFSQARTPITKFHLAAMIRQEDILRRK